MKNCKKVLKIVLLIILFILLYWLLIICVLPKQLVTQPHIYGKVKDTSDLPIKGAVVYRLMERYYKNPDHGYEERVKIVLDEQITNEEGIFIFKEVIEKKWFKMKIFRPKNNCEIILKVQKEGYENYETNQSILNESHFICKSITFEPIIILQEK